MWERKNLPEVVIDSGSIGKIWKCGQSYLIWHLYTLRDKNMLNDTEALVKKASLLREQLTGFILNEAIFILNQVESDLRREAVIPPVDPSDKSQL